MFGQKAREITYCKTCITPSSRPRVVFNEEGICNACLHAKDKPNIDWDARAAEFKSLIEPYRSSKNKWDCVVPWSGGKDSSSIAYKLKFEYGMNPLLVTYSPLIPNEIGNHNREAMLNAGFDTIFFRSNQKVARHLARRFFIERGNPKVAWDAGINAVPVQAAVSYKIPLVFYAEHGETEYGGKVIDEESAKRRNFTEVIEHQIGDDPRNWLDDQVNERDLASYIYPEQSEIEQVGLVAYYFAYFHRWSMFENYQYLKDKIDFKTHPNGRTPGTFTNFDSLDDKIDALYYYMQFIKFGFGRTVRDSGRLIQNNQMTREEALKLAHEYDAEFPEEYFEEVLDYLSLNRREFEEIVDKHRNPEVWYKEGEKWLLKHPLPAIN